MISRPSYKHTLQSVPLPMLTAQQMEFWKVPFDEFCETQENEFICKNVISRFRASKWAASMERSC